MGGIATFDKKGSHFQRFGLKILRLSCEPGLKPGSHDSISMSIRAKQKAKQRNQVKPATRIVISISIRS